MIFGLKRKDRSAPGRWTAERANAWYAGQPWLVGANFVPSTASNQLEMWQAETFDPETIDRELGWAASLGMNSMRVFLHDLLWEDDAAGFTDRIDSYLDIAAEHGIPTGFMTMASCLTTGPVTLAGNLAVGNAEVIAATALLQLAYPGAPVFYAAAQTASDLRLGSYTGGGPEEIRGPYADESPPLPAHQAR